MRNIKRYNQFVNEEFRDPTDEETARKNRAQSEEDDQMYHTFTDTVSIPKDIKNIINKIGGGVSNIKYGVNDIIVDKSPETDEEKKEYDRGKKITYRESMAFRKKHIMTTTDGVKIYLVDAEYVRDEIDIDFTMGGNAYRYPDYMPEDEVWIDDEMDEIDIFSTIVHELTERKLMKTSHMSYDKAHDIASSEELKIRKNLEKKYEK